MGDSDDRGPQLEAVVISFLVLCTITVSLRCYCRIIMLKNFLLEDWLAVVTLILYAAYSAMGILAVQHGLGKRAADVPPAEIPQAIMYRWIASIFYIVISALTKIIVAAFLLRVCTRERWQRVLLWTSSIVIAAYSTFYVILNINSCHPLSYEWTRLGPDPPAHGDCQSEKLAMIATYISALLNVLVDWMLAILPACLLWKLQVERRLKIWTYFLLSLGSISSIATIVRIPYAKDFLATNSDIMYNFTDLGIWSTVEIGVALSASSVATLKPLFSRLKIFASSTISTVPSSIQRRLSRRSSKPLPALPIDGVNRDPGVEKGVWTYDKIMMLPIQGVHEKARRDDMV